MRSSGTLTTNWDWRGCRHPRKGLLLLCYPVLQEGGAPRSPQDGRLQGPCSRAPACSAQGESTWTTHWSGSPNEWSWLRLLDGVHLWLTTHLLSDLRLEGIDTGVANTRFHLVRSGREARSSETLVAATCRQQPFRLTELGRRISTRLILTTASNVYIDLHGNSCYPPLHGLTGMDPLAKPAKSPLGTKVIERRKNLLPGPCRLSSQPIIDEPLLASQIWLDASSSRFKKIA